MASTLLTLALTVALLPGMASGAPVPPDDASTTSTADDEPIRLLVKLDTDTDDAVPGPMSGGPVRSEQARAAMDRAGDRVAAAMSDQARVNRRFQRLPYLAVEVAADEVDDLLAHPDVVSVGEDETVEPLLDRSVPLVGASEDPDGPGVAPTLAGQELTGEGTSIAVIDTGVLTSHKFFDGRDITEACFLGSNEDDADADGEEGENGDDEGGCPRGSTEEHGDGAAAPTDDDGHGTHVAGIALGAGEWADQERRGVAPDADLIAVRVLESGGGSLSDIVAAMDWLMRQVVEGEDGFDQLAAVNLSLGTDPHEPGSCPASRWEAFADAVDVLAEAGVATIAAAGNDKNGNAMGAPACLESVISVAASTVDDPGAFASFTDVSHDTDLIAPGEGIWSAGIDGDQDWVSADGTSMAAPHVAGAAALLKQAAPHAGADDLRHALTEAAPETGLDDDRDGGTVKDLPPLAVRHHVLHLPGTPNAPSQPQPEEFTVDVGTTDGSVEVNWELEGSADEVHAVAAPNGQWCGDASADGTCTIDGLSAGEPVTITLTATTADATSAASDPSEAVIPLAVPDAPDDLQATVERDGEPTVELTWDEPFAGGTEITGYVAEISPADDGVPIECPTPATSTTCTATGLVEGASYEATVFARNDQGDGASTSVEFLAALPPDAPSNAQARALETTGAIQVSWEAPEDDGGLPISSYTVSATGPDDPGGCQIDSGLEDGLSCTITDLIDGTEYTFTVVATNAVGDSAPSDPTAPVAPTVGSPNDGDGGGDTGGGGTGGGGGGGSAAGGAPPPDDEPLEDEDEAEIDEPVAPGGTQPAPPPGDAQLHLDGQSTSSSATWSISNVTWNGGDLSASLGASDGDGVTSPVRGGELTVPAGGNVQVSMAGLEGGSDVVGWLFSDPVKLGTLTVGSDGTVEGRLAAPGDLPPGDHTLQLVGRDGQGRQVALSVGVTVGAIEGRFPDVTVGSTHWLAIERVADIGVALGDVDGSYRPADPVTRGQMASFLARQLELPAGDGTASGGLSDIDGSTHADAIRAVVDTGIAQGRLDGTYGPSDSVTRGQIATLLANAAELDPLDDGPFSDVSGVHAGAINAVEDAGLVGGFPDGTYGGSRSLTRAQMATMLVGLEAHLEG